jgi:hypothetical protein
MNKLIITSVALVSAAMAGCVALPPRLNAAGQPPTPQVLAECDYETSKATANIRSGIEAGFMKGELTNKCLAAKGYK